MASMLIGYPYVFLVVANTGACCVGAVQAFLSTLTLCFGEWLSISLARFLRWLPGSDLSLSPCDETRCLAKKFRTRRSRLMHTSLVCKTVHWRCRDESAPWWLAFFGSLKMVTEVHTRVHHHTAPDLLPWFAPFCGCAWRWGVPMLELRQAPGRIQECANNASCWLDHLASQKPVYIKKNHVSLNARKLSLCDVGATTRLTSSAMQSSLSHWRQSFVPGQNGF